MKPFTLAGLALLAITATATSVTAMAADSGSKIPKSFKWVDSKGVTHYGDTIPPEAAQGHSAELNNQGVELRRYPAKLSPAEQASADARATDDARKLQHDQFLLTTYTSARDIEQLRDERLQQLEGQVVTARSYIDSVDKRLATLNERAMAFKPYSKAPGARRLPDTLAAEIVRSVSEGRSQRLVLEGKQAEQREQRAKFQADIDRYQQLVAARKPR